MLLVDEPDSGVLPQVSELLERELPETCRGYRVRFPVTWDDSRSHRVEVATVAGFAASLLGVDPVGGLSVLDWLVLTGQSVLEVTAGPVFADQTVALSQVRATLSWYPPDVERYVLAAGGQRLEQQLPLVGHTAERGDELGSRLLSGQLAEDLMFLGFALSRRWAPYAKWRGTVFATLPVAVFPVRSPGRRRDQARLAGPRKRPGRGRGSAARRATRPGPARPGPRGRPVLGPAVPRHRPGRAGLPPRGHHRCRRRPAATRHRFGRAVGGQR